LTEPTLLRGRVLTFHAEPSGPDDTASYTYIEDGAVRLQDGKIIGLGEFADVFQDTDIVIDHRPHLIMPGFIDTHIHYPQMQVLGSWGAKLLDWLSTYTFPEEAKFSDPDHAHRIAKAFFAEVLRNGTTTPVAYCTSHAPSAEAFFSVAAEQNIRVIGGKVLMDRGAPDAVLDTPQSGYDDSTALINKWHGNGRASYAITPRFAITSTPEQMAVAQTLMSENPSCYMQTHLSENVDEIEFTLSLYPQAKDYLDVYETYELLGEKSLFGHAIHLSDREVGALSETGSAAVYCPTSNAFLGSGMYDEATLANAGVKRAIATDVGGGTSFSMLKTLDEGYKLLQFRNQKLHPLKSFYWITLGNANALSMTDKIGTLDVGTEADVVVLDTRATPVMALRMETVEHLWEELFVLQTLGDDRSVVQTYVAAEPTQPV
jgi:guanine deaminase